MRIVVSRVFRQRRILTGYLLVDLSIYVSVHLLLSI